MSTLLYVFLFLLGYGMSTFVSFFRTYKQSSVLVENTKKQILKLLGGSVQKMSQMDQLFYNQLERLSGWETAALAKNLDKMDYNHWKEETIDMILQNFPKGFEKQINFTDWGEAMQELDKIYKEEYPSIKTTYE